MEPEQPVVNQPVPEVVQSQPPTEQPSAPSTKRWLIIGGVVLVVILAAGVGVLGYQNFKAGQQTQTPTPTAASELPPAPPPVPSEPTTDETANWKMYTNKLWKFSIKYPEEQLVACNPSDETGLKLWTAPFDCPSGHDIFYEVSVIGYKEGDYSEYKQPISVKDVVVNGNKATQKMYKYEDVDGPLQALGGATEVLITTKGGVIQLYLLGNETAKTERFHQILSTFQFTN